MPDPKHGYEPPPPMSRTGLVVFLVAVVGLTAYALIDEASKARRKADLKASGEVDWEEVREEHLREERAAARAKRELLVREEELRQKVLDARKAHVEACIEERAKFLPGLLPSPLAKSKIAADCAEQEARMERAGQLPPLPAP